MLTPVILRGSLVQLEPMTIDHTQALCDAASENRTTYAYTHVPDGIEETKRYIERALSDYEKDLHCLLQYGVLKQTESSEARGLWMRKCLRGRRTRPGSV